MSRAARLPALGLMVLLLAGCFVSKTALIPQGEAEPVLDGKTAYTRSSLADDGKTWVEDETGVLQAVDGGYVVNAGEDGDDAPFVLRRAFDDLYVTQQSGDGEFYYDLARLDGDRLYVYNFTCGDEDQRHVDAGLIDSISGGGRDLLCNVSDFDKLVRVFKARLQNGVRPKTLYVIS